MNEQHEFRSVLLKIQDLLSNADRERLHFLFGDDVPRCLRDDLSLGGTLRVLESLLSKAIISDQDCIYLLEAVNKIDCRETAQRLQKYQQIQRQNGKEDFKLQDVPWNNEEEDRMMTHNLKEVNNIERKTIQTLPTIPNNTEKCSYQFSRINIIFKKSLNIREILLFIIILIILALLLFIGFYRKSYKNVITTIQVPFRSININPNASWSQISKIVFGGNGSGSSLNHLSHPYGLYIDDRIIYIADEQNHRIIAWECGKTNGEVIAGGNDIGSRKNQLNGPTDVIVDKTTDSIIICDYGNRRVMKWPRKGGTIGEIILSDGGYFGLTIDDRGFLYVTDREKSNVQRLKIGDKNSIIVAGRTGKGDYLNQLNEPRYVFVDQDYSIYISDWNNDRVMKWIDGSKQGIVVAGGYGHGNRSTQLSYPEGIFVDKLGTVYVVDQWNHRIMRWPKYATEGDVIVSRNQENNIYRPVGLSFDQHGNIYLVEHENHRIVKFDINQNSIS